jgi:hypothetical protein
MVRRFYSSGARKAKNKIPQKSPSLSLGKWSLKLEKLPGWLKIGLAVLSFLICFLVGSFLSLSLNRSTVNFLTHLGKLPH